MGNRDQERQSQGQGDCEDGCGEEDIKSDHYDRIAKMMVA